jgi:hypothetical protein
MRMPHDEGDCHRSRASAALIFAASHVRVDRVHWKTNVSLVGPAASWITPLVLTGWLFSIIAPGLAAKAMKQGRRGCITLGVLALYLALVNLLGSFFFIGVFED